MEKMMKKLFHRKDIIHLKAEFLDFSQLSFLLFVLSILFNEVVNYFFLPPSFSNCFVALL